MDIDSTYASNQYNTDLVLQLKQQLDNLLTETTSGKKSTNFEGVADVAQQALDLGNQESSITSLLGNNTVVGIKLNTMSTVFGSVQTVMSNFQQELQNFIDNDQQSNSQDVATLQQNAFSALQNMEYYLNTQVDGQYVFSGSKTDTPPVNIGAGTLSAFQSIYDGYNVSYPTTGAADLSTTSTSVANTGSITFNAAAGTISAENAGQFANIPTGSVITLSGSPSYDGQYTVLANDGTNITVSHNLVNEGDPTTSQPSQVTITTSSEATQDPNLNISTGVYFTQPGVITAATQGALSGLKVGDSFTVSGAQNAANNGNFIVAATDGTNVEIERANLTSPAAFSTTGNPDTTATITTNVGTAAETYTNATTGIDFNANGTISEPDSAALSAIPVGSYITVTGAAQAANDGTYLVTANDGGVLSVSNAVATSLTNEAANSAAQIDNGTATTFMPGSLSFDAASSVITAGTSGSLNGITTGQTVSVSGSAANNGSFTVTQTFKTPVVSEVAAAGATLVVNGGSAAIASAGALQFSAGSPPTLTGAPGDLGNLQAGDAINVTGTNSNNGAFVVTGTALNQFVSGNDTAATLTDGATSYAPGTTGSLTFAANGSTVVAATAGSLAGIKAGDLVAVSGASAGTGTSAANNGTRLVTQVFSTPVTTEGGTDDTATIQDGNSSFATAATGGLTFDGAANTISAATAGSLTGVQVGDVITVAGAGNSANDASFVVTANNGTTLTLAQPNTAVQMADDTVTLAPPNTAVEVAKPISLSTSSYYQGNGTALSQDIDVNTPLNYGVTAMDPAFEKAIRAMALVAEGQTGTAGGLDMNLGRVTDANYLMASAIDGTAQGTPPFGTESSSNLNQLQQTLDTQQSQLNTITTQQTNYQTFLQNSVNSMLNSDPTQTIVELIQQQTALQASYQALSTVQQLSLLNYLK